MNYIVGGCLLAFGIEDIRRQSIPVWALVVAVAGSMIYGIVYKDVGSLVLGAVPGVCMVILAILLPQSLGIGDGILAVAYGILYGWRSACIWLMVGFLLAAVFGLFCRLAVRKRHVSIPFIPFLTAVHVGMCI